MLKIKLWLQCKICGCEEFFVLANSAGDCFPTCAHCGNKTFLNFNKEVPTALKEIKKAKYRKK
jgi:hypothetical protein